MDNLYESLDKLSLLRWLVFGLTPPPPQWLLGLQPKCFFIGLSYLVMILMLSASLHISTLEHGQI